MLRNVLHSFYSNQCQQGNLGDIGDLTSIFNSGIKPDDVQEVYLGNVCTAGEGQAPTRQATLGAGIRASMIFPSGLKSVLYITGYFGHKKN